jgi:hypothetical protein
MSQFFSIKFFTNLFLLKIPLTEEDLQMKTYGNLYRKLATTTSDIPIGIYRTEKQDKINEDRLVNRIK